MACWTFNAKWWRFARFSISLNSAKRQHQFWVQIFDTERYNLNIRARYIAFTLLDTMILGHLPSCVQGSTFTNWLKVEDRLRRKLCRACFISLFLTCSPINASLTSQHGMSKIEASLIRAVFCIWRPLWTTN